MKQYGLLISLLKIMSFGPGVFPALEEKSFIRNFNDEMIAVKRPGYYAVCYVGKPAAGDYYISQRENFRLPLPDNAEDNGGIVNARKVNPFLGGGLSGFWTPEYGHSLMAANWAPTTHHGLIATLSDGNRYWEDYFEHQFHLDKEKGELVIEGVIESLPLKYRRRYVFLDDLLEVELVIHAADDVVLKQLVENIPIARGGWKGRGADINGQSEGNSFTLSDFHGAGVEFKFDTSRSLKIVSNGMKTGGWRKLQIGRVEIKLPAIIERDEIVKITYQIIPFHERMQ
jgi:hypothetical protein